MSAIQQNLEAASAAYSASFTQGNLALPPAKKYLVVTCMDARIDPARAFGIELGDAHVIRNVSDPRPNRAFHVSMHHGAMELCISPVCCPSIM
jgi:carbonic anhydrase